MPKIDPATGLQFEVKQPSESRLYSVDYSNLMESGELITAILETIVTPQGKVVQVDALVFGTQTIASTIIKTRFEMGTDGEDYKITMKVNTDLGNTIEGDILIRVTDL